MTHRTELSQPNASRRPRRTSGGDLLAAVPDMLFRLDRDGRFLDYKPAQGLEPYVPQSEFMGRTVREVLPAAVAETCMGAIAEALRVGLSEPFEYDLNLDDGVHRYEARVVSLTESEVLVVVRDWSILPKVGLTRTRARYSLTKRELTVLRNVAIGLTDKEIGRALHISPETVHKHVAAVRAKMGARSRTEASVRAVQEGVIG